METDNRFNLPRTTIEKVLLSITVILLALIIIISSTLIIQNSYTEKITDDDIVFSYTIYGNEIAVKINPLTDVKNLKFTLTFKSKNKIHDEHFKVDKCKGAQSLEKIFNKQGISEQLNGDEPISVSLKIKSGYKKVESEYQKTIFNDCDFEFEYKALSGDHPRQIEHKFTTTVTNESNESIVSIQNLRMTLRFKQNIKCRIEEKIYNFETPLKPGETREIAITYDNINFIFPETFTDEEKEAFFAQKQEAISYSNESYSTVNGSKVIQSEYEKNKEQQNVRYTYTTVPVKITNK